MSDMGQQHQGAKQKRKHPAAYHESYYAKQQRMSGQCLGKEMKGFFITCNMREKEATIEAYALLNEYANEKYGPEFQEEPKADFWAERASDDEEDIDKAVANEVSDLNERAKSTTVRRFKAVNSGASNILFVKTTLDSPNELFEPIVTDLYSKKIPKTRYVMRMYPVAGTCKVQNYADEIQEILRPFFSDAVGHSFYIKIKIRNNDGGIRDAIFKTFCYVIRGLNMENKPNYSTYEYIVIIDVIKTVLCVSVLKNYKLYKEYNLQSLGDPLKPDYVEPEKKVEEEGSGDKKDGENVDEKEEGAEKEKVVGEDNLGGEGKQIDEAKKNDEQGEEEKKGDTLEAEEKAVTEADDLKKAETQEVEEKKDAVEGEEGKKEDA